MEFKVSEKEPLTIYCSGLETTFPTMVNDTEPLMHHLNEFSQQNKENLAGPQHWIYEGVTDPECRFQLTVAQPIKNEVETKNGFNVKKLESFKCVTHIHKGPWEKLSETYQQIMPAIAQQGFEITGNCREAYLECNFENPENNIVEIQVGIQ